MSCERCGGRVATYELDGRDALACNECGYVDIPVEHEPETTHSESWWEALDRFFEENTESGRPVYPTGPRVDLQAEDD